jgi:hypothetical protein
MGEFVCRSLAVMSQERPERHDDGYGTREMPLTMPISDTYLKIII